MAITAKELAALAGVSRGTVDRALHHRGGVAPAVQQRIEALALEHGYAPNRAGKALGSRAPVTIAVLLNAAGNPFFDEVKRGLRLAVEEYGEFTVRLALREVKGYDPAGQLAWLDGTDIAGADGLILTPISHPEIAARLNTLADAGMPVVALNNDVACRRTCYVGCDYENSGRTAAQLMGYLCGGKGDVAAVTGSLSMLGHAQRVEGFRAQLAAAFPAMRLVEVVENQDDDDRSAAVVTDLCRRHDLRGLYFGAAGAAAGSRAARAVAGEKLTVVASDPVPAVARLIREGAVQAVVDQQPLEQGRQAMRAVLEKVLFGVDPPADCLFTHNEIKICTNL